ncbi:hypothetical protein VM99_24420 [Pseudomonas chlororaphis]|uniref:Uncharacterized protein n=1 Tax=Pseudomonas chlororaphis TaxID=587753 RepID=A0A0G3GNA5_9PSED|nr:hypothetical protein VM99_24420 [Pseudomonas chlororaphis]
MVAALFGIVQRTFCFQVRVLIYPPITPSVEAGGKMAQVDTGIQSDFIQKVLSDDTYSLGGMIEAMSNQLQIILVQFHGFGGS